MQKQRVAGVQDFATMATLGLIMGSCATGRPKVDVAALPAYPKDFDTRREHYMQVSEASTTCCVG